VRPEVEVMPGDNKWARPAVPKISFLGAEEVRDMRLVTPEQLVNFPKRTAGQVRALEQMAGSRLKWRVRIGPDAYFSFLPLGSEVPCPCTYRVGVRNAGVIKELYRIEAAPIGRFAPARVDVDLTEYTGHEVDLLIQLEAPPEALVHPPGQPFPTALWGSPALYQRRSAAGKELAKPSGATASRPNVLFLGIDTLRADRLGPWGHNPTLTTLSPSIDRLAEQSDVWLDTFSVVNATNPSFASMMTGLYVKNHGVYDLKTPLPPSHVTLAELFQGAGYDTMAIISAAHLRDQNSGLGQGFQDVTGATEHFAGELAVDMTMDWLQARDGKKPFFAWIHLFDPHTPHTPPQPYALGFRPASDMGLAPVRTWVPFRQPGPRDFEEPNLGGHRDLYDGEVAYLDRQIGRLLDFLEGRGMLDNTLIVLIADHGENLGDHNILYRHIGLFDSTTHVPMMIRWPGRERKGRRLHGLVQTIDVFPTVLKAAGLKPPASDGTDLRELTGEEKKGRRAIFAEHAGKLGLMVRTPEYDYMLSQGNTPFVPDGTYLYDLKADPGETRNLAGRSLPAEIQLSDLLKRWLAVRRDRPDAPGREQTDEEKARLKALGYIQ
jgi:arylsulfatase A-like enzyme